MKHTHPAIFSAEAPSGKYNFVVIGATPEQRALLDYALPMHNYTLVAVRHVDQALRCLRQHHTDLVLIAETEDRTRLASLVKTFCEKTDLPTAVLPISDDVSHLVAILRCGADLLLPTASDPHLIHASLTSFARRLRFVRDATGPETCVTHRGSLRLDHDCSAATWKGVSVTLTPSEFSIFCALAERPMHIKSREQLNGVVSPNGAYVDDRTIDCHIRRLRKKMRTIDADFDAIETVYGLGYRFRQDEPDINRRDARGLREG